MDLERRWKGSAMPLDNPTRPAAATNITVSLAPKPATEHVAVTAPIDVIPRRSR